MSSADKGQETDLFEKYPLTDEDRRLLEKYGVKQDPAK